MKSRNKIIVVIAISLVLAGCTFLATTKDDMNKADEMAASTGTSGSYEEYSAAAFDELLGSKRFLVFFHADWCPLCRALEGKIKENMSVLNGHTLLEANYDTEIELKKEFGVVAQTTVLFFDEDGTLVEKKVNPRLTQIEEFFM